MSCHHVFKGHEYALKKDNSVKIVLSLFSEKGSTLKEKNLLL